MILHNRSPKQCTSTAPNDGLVKFSSQFTQLCMKKEGKKGEKRKNLIHKSRKKGGKERRKKSGERRRKNL